MNQYTYYQYYTSPHNKITKNKMLNRHTFRWPIRIYKCKREEHYRKMNIIAYIK